MLYIRPSLARSVFSFALRFLSGLSSFDGYSGAPSSPPSVNHVLLVLADLLVTGGVRKLKDKRKV